MLELPSDQYQINQELEFVWRGEISEEGLHLYLIFTQFQIYYLLHLTKSQEYHNLLAQFPFDNLTDRIFF